MSPPWRGGLAGCTLVLLVVSLFSTNLRAAGVPPPEYSDLEQRTLRSVLGSLKGELDTKPAGKRIRRIRVVIQEVFDEQDPIPDFVNVLHTTSRDHAITRELLFRSGDALEQAKLDESARNLRALRQLSLVLIVPIRAPDGAVDVLVITRDVWSLRLNWDLQFEGTRLNYIVLNPSEENLFGTHANVGGLFVLTRANYSAGLVLGVPRIAGSRVLGTLSANLIFNRETGQREGSSGGAFVGQPLYSVDTRWAWATGIQWSKSVFRAFEGGQPTLVDLPGTDAVERIPWQYRTVSAAAGAEVLRSYGRRLKLDVSFGVEGNTMTYDSFELGGLEPEVASEFVRLAIPVGTSRVSPVFQIRSYRSDFAPLIEINSLGLQEDYRLGPEALIRFFPATESLGSSRDMIGIVGGVGYSARLGDGLARGVVSSRLELASRARNDVAHEVATLVASPRLRTGRLHHAAFLQWRPQNYSNRGIVLGGDNRLRGFPSGAFVGTSAVVSNLEFRTRSVDVLSAQVGAAVFYDTGAALGGLQKHQYGHGVGAGMRALLPQFGRVVLRFDWAFPLGDPRYKPLPGALFVAFEQAFSVPGLKSPSLVGGFF